MITSNCFEIVQVEAVKGLPAMRDGRPHQVDVVSCRSNLFNEPVIVTSDLHKDAQQVFEGLDEQLNPGDWNVVTCGDMAGTTQWGEDADPLAVLSFVLENFRSLHAVLGNHDINSEALTDLKNIDGQVCCLDGQPRVLAGRRICGVSGIMGTRNRPGRITPDLFVEALAKALGATKSQSILFTHETPRIGGFTPSSGKDALADAVRRLSPAAHFFGHSHLEPVVMEDHGSAYVNVDNRVLLVEPR